MYKNTRIIDIKNPLQPKIESSIGLDNSKCIFYVDSKRRDNLSYQTWEYNDIIELYEMGLSLSEISEHNYNFNGYFPALAKIKKVVMFALPIICPDCEEENDHLISDLNIFITCPACDATHDLDNLLTDDQMVALDHFIKYNE
jgi:hypothetical protein